LDVDSVSETDAIILSKKMTLNMKHEVSNGEGKNQPEILGTMPPEIE
jgi:hypothetical protein